MKTPETQTKEYKDRCAAHLDYLKSQHTPEQIKAAEARANARKATLIFGCRGK